MRQTFAYLSSGSRVSGEGVERLVGRATYLCMFDRGLLSVFRHLYTFAAEMKRKRGASWASARREAGWLRELLPLARASMRRAPGVFASDASEDGYGVMSAPLGECFVREQCHWRERWR